MLGIRQWRHGAFCISRQHRLRHQWPRCILIYLFIVCESKFTIGESQTISHANDTQAQQVTPNPRPGRFSAETPLEWERWLQIQREQWRRKRSIMIVHCPKPIPADICRSKSAKFQLCIMARTTIIFKRTAPDQICSLFWCFSISGRQNNATPDFQYTVNNNTT